MKRRVANAFGGKKKPEKANEEPQRRKVYDKNVGEYVKYREESQVSDVEFEEIRD